MRLLPRILLTLFLLSLPAWAYQEHNHPLSSEELGSVQFHNSCARAVETDFNRAVALLHSFQYEQARLAFASVSANDPTCAMAQWGIAMSHYHGLWDSGDLAAGREAINRAGQLAASNKRTTAREMAYINALAEIYSPDARDKAAHAQAFERDMAAVQAAYPDDDEAAILHALTLAIAAPKTDKTFSNQRKCGEILEPLFAKYPHHPGIAHYIIHCYDNPVLAEKALPAARAYAKIAPASAHAHHMPSHIFTRLGLWDESIASNINSARVAAAAEKTSKNGEARDQRLHAMDYLEYAYLQSGRVKQAKAVLDEMNTLEPVPGVTLTNDYAVAAIPARYAIERGDWKQASALRVSRSGVPWADAITWMAVGIGSARTGGMDRARQAEQALASLRNATSAQHSQYWSDQIEVQRREVAAWISQMSQQPAEALRTMRSAVELEESMDKHAVTPGAITPAREMLAQLLALQHRPREAVSEYEAVLKLAPNRFNALYGAATAAENAGDSVTAANYFRKLTEIAVGDERPELSTARKKITVAMK